MRFARYPALATLILAACAGSAAHADSFYFAPAPNVSYSFDLDAADGTSYPFDNYNSLGFQRVTLTGNNDTTTLGNVYFWTPSYTYGGNFELSLNNAVYDYHGTRLFTGSGGYDAQFTPGFYALGNSSGTSPSTFGYLQIVNQPPPAPTQTSIVTTETTTPTTAVTPEPSSLILLGTGIVTAAGTRRRKLSAIIAAAYARYC